MKYLAPLTAFSLKHIQTVRARLLKDLVMEELEWKAYFERETRYATED